ncbi:MAG: homoserine kinase [Proteobacteria bacterium]|nr:homoserine kinase [Pseudomonadota bacterium]
MAVYTHIDKKDIAQFLSRYDAGELTSFKGIAEGVENSNFLIQTSEGKYILTVYEKRVSEQELPFFTGLMDHLSHKSIPCPSPIKDRKGNALQTLKGKPAAMVSFLKGDSVKNIKTIHCREVGRALAEMHLATEGFKHSRINSMGVQNWRKIFDSCKAKMDAVEKGVAAELENCLERIESHWPKRLPAGVIHADLFPDNVFFLEDTLSGMIDFYFACNDFFAYDIAVCLNSWCFEGKTEFNITKARHMLSAYDEVRPFSEEERNALPVLASGAALRFLLSRLYDWLNQVEGAMVTPKDPKEYLKKLRFHMQVKSAAEYGL